MTVSSPPTYRNTRQNFYTDKSSDNNPVGSIISTFKSITNVYDNNYIPLTSYRVVAGNSNTQNKPEYQYPGYVYCDGAEYNISDFPVLYSIIGNDYGGTARPAINIIDGGSGYDAATGIIFSPAPTGGTTIVADLNIVNGVVTAVNITEVGAGYITEPTFSFINAGSGTGLDLEINIGNDGSLETINKDNVFEHWGESRSLGTFTVPDLKTKKVVGYGNVYGIGSPSIGLLTLGAGATNGIVKQGGSWYFDKGSQAGYFALGTITTTGYERVTNDVSTSVIGNQKISVTMDQRRLQRVPEHDHFIYSTRADDTFGWHSALSYDRYLVDYSNATARLNTWTPVGGLQYEHKHGLSKQAISEPTVATYDVYDWNAGADGTGSIKYKTATGDFYFASGGAGSGTFEEQTYIPNTLFRTFVGTSTNGSAIGNREVRTGGKEIITYTQDIEYTGSTNISFPSNWETMDIEIQGGGGSGSDGTQAGNDGNDVSFSVTAGGTLLSLTAEGGEGGGKSSNFTSGGTGGQVIKSGSALNDGIVVSEVSADGTAGQQGSGAGGIFPGSSNPDNPNQAGVGGASLVRTNTGGGSDGIHTFIGTASNVQNSYTYQPSTSIQTATLTTSSKFTEIKVILGAGAGGDSQQGTTPSFTTYNNVRGGTGYPGAVTTVEVLNPDGSNSWQFTLQPGYQGQRWSGGNGDGTGGAGGNGWNNSSGQRGGDGATDDGGGGGGATVVFLNGVLVAGAGGGGGGGGLQNDQTYPYNGGDGEPATNLIYESTAALYTGGGTAGGNYGCVGGGGGGGGGGVAPSGSQGGGSGGAGGDPNGVGGWAGHGGGKGGKSGTSAVDTNVFNHINTTASNGGGGYVTIETTEDNSAWSPGGGGGGAGGYLNYTIKNAKLPGASSAQLTYNGSSSSGVGGTNNGYPPYARVGFGVVTGYDGGEVTTTTGDIIVDANTGTNIYASGAGTGAGGGFALPVTQVPEVEFIGGGGNGAAASVVVSGGKVTSISLDNAGTGYTSAPQVRIKHGAGTRAFATCTVQESGNRSIDTLVLSSQVVPEAYNTAWGYVKLSGDDLTRYVVVREADTTNVKRFYIKVARGNGVNGGNTPENGGDELKIYYNTDLSLNFSSFLGVIVPIPTSQELSNLYDGTGSGGNPTNWYWYGIDLPTAAQKANVRFKIVQDRNAAGAGNDNASDTDHYGICDFIYEYKQITELVYVPAAGKMSTNIDELSYDIGGPVDSFYRSGAVGNDATFTMTPQVPLIPDAAIDPDKNIPLVEPYHLTKYLIKAF